MSSYVTRKTPGDTAWFVHDRFGMFIHYGMYAMCARHEWTKGREHMTDEDYDQRYIKYFNPDMFDAKDWARQAKKAGMKYAILTTKHHEGFCMFDSAYTDYKITNTPFGRDLVREFVDAFRAEGLKVGLYYSLIDWHHPDFTIDKFHPYNTAENAEELNKTRDITKYSEYLYNQVEELMTNYGKIDILWFDFSYDGEGKWQGKGKEVWQTEKVIKRVRELQPGIIIDNRADLEQDLWTPEQFQPTFWPTHRETGELVVWEACQTFSGSWGYSRDETSWKSHDMLIRMLVSTVSLGGNLLLNVGPTARGYFDYRATEALEAFGEWMKYNSRSIYGCTMAEPEFKAPSGCKYTQSEDGKRLYVHLFEYPFRFLELPGLAGKIDYAQFLHDASEILYSEEDAVYFTDQYDTDLSGSVVMNIPVLKPNTLVPVIEIFLK